MMPQLRLKTKPRFRSLRVELTCWFLLLTLVPLVLVSSIGYWQARESLIESSAAQLKKNSDNTIQFINNWFGYRWMDINRLVDTEQTVEFLETLSQKRLTSHQSLSDFVQSYTWTEVANKFQGDFVKLARRYDYIYDIFLIDAAGNIVYTVAKESDFGTNLFQGPYSNTLFAATVKQSLESGETVFSDFERYAPSAGIEAGFIAAPLINNQGDKIGIVSIQIRLDRIQGAFDGLRNEDTLQYLTARDGILRTVIDDKDEVLVRNMGAYKAPLTITLEAQNRSVETVENYIGARGNEVIGLASRVNIWNVEWILVSEVNRATALASANWLGQFVLISLLITVALVSYIAFIVSRKITRPIAVLAQATELMANGQLDTPVTLKASNEIGRLASAFNKMMDSRRLHEAVILQEKSNAEQASLAKSEFLACMSHEIRTPMNGVLGMLSLTINSDVTDEQKRKLLIAQSSAQSLLSLINDILDYSKIEAGKLELEMLDFNLVDLLGEVAQASALKSNENGVELILDIGHVDPTMIVKGDPSRLRQILVNLLGNANKFTFKGEIVLSAKVLSLDDGLNLLCTVSDTGIGIPQDKISALFDSFSQVDTSTTRKFGGTGLGLAICQRLIKLTGGEIKVSSEYGVGSTFEFNMRLERSAMTPQSKSVYSLLDANILILDDNRTNREIFRAQIESWGGRVTEVSSVDDALVICRAEHKFDAVLVDMQMPEKSGIDFAKALQLEPKIATMKLLLLSSIDDPVKHARLIELGFSASIAKPVVPSDLFDSLNILLDKNRKLDQIPCLLTPGYLRNLRMQKSEGVVEVPNWSADVRILLVEDNRVNQEVVNGILASFNLQCDVANNGLEAVELLLEAPDTSPYTLVLMDCQMPEMDGYTATQEIRLGNAGQSNKNIPIVAMTANAMRGDKEKCIDAGMNDYLTKPLDPENVLSMLVNWLDQRPKTTADEAMLHKKADTSAVIKNKTINIPSGLVTFDLHSSPPDIAKNPALYLKVLSLYLNDNEKYCEKLLDLAEIKDINALRNVVHSIKGACGNLGIVKVYNFAENFEACILENAIIPIGAAEKLAELINQSFQDVALILKENQ